jgi:hypothetical protein
MASLQLGIDRLQLAAESQSSHRNTATTTVIKHSNSSKPYHIPEVSFWYSQRTRNPAVSLKKIEVDIQNLLCGTRLKTQNMIPTLDRHSLVQVYGTPIPLLVPETAQH